MEKNNSPSRKKSFVAILIAFFSVLMLNLMPISATTWGNSTGYCYQEFFTNTTACGGLDGGVWTGDPFIYDKDKMFDGDWNTYAYLGAGGTRYVYFNYTKPDNADNGTIWQVKDHGGTANVTITSGCLDYYDDVLRLRGELNDGGVQEAKWYCYDGSWTVLRAVGAGTRRLYEEAMFWNMSRSIVLNSPTNDTGSNTGSVTFNCSSEIIDEYSLANISLWTNSTGTWHKNKTNTVTGSSNTTTFTVNYPEIDILWTCEACGTDGNCAYSNENRTTFMDTTDPSINILIPSNEEDIGFYNINQSLNWTITEPHLNTTIFQYEGSNTTITGNTSFALSSGIYQNLTFYADDKAGNAASLLHEWIYKIFVENETYSAQSYETSTETLSIELLYNSSRWNVITAILTYNGTEYAGTRSGTGNSITFSRSLDIPLLSGASAENKTFYWTIGLTNSTGTYYYNTTTNTQQVNPLDLGDCVGGTTIEALNFTAYDEASLARLNGFNFKATFNFYTGNGDIIKNASFDDEDVHERLICINQHTDFHIDAEVEYNYNKTGYVTRNYYFENDVINNQTQNIDLLLLNETDSTSFIIKVRDNNLLALAGYLVFIERYYVETDEYKVAQVIKTDDNGQSVAFFKTEIADYRFIVKDEGVTYLTTTKQKIIPETSPYTITLTLTEDLGKPWADLEDLENFTYTLDFDDTTEDVTYTYTDSDTSFESGRLVVYQLNVSGADLLLCNLSSTDSAASLVCDLTGNESGRYNAIAYTTRGGTQYLVDVSIFEIESFSAVAGMLGMFLGFFIILIAVCSFAFNEIVGVWAVTIAVISVNFMQLINFGGVFITVLLGVAVMITIAFSK